MKEQLAIVMAAALMAPAAFAQREADQTPGQPGQTQPGQIQQHQTTQGGTLSAQQLKHVRASNLMGSKIQSKDGGNLGSVEDITFNPQTGQVNFILLGKGGFLGMGEKLVPVPWQAVNLRSERELVVNVDQQKLRGAPMYESQQHTELDKPDVILRVYRFYAIEPIGAGAPGSETGREEGTQQGQEQKEKN